VIYVVLGMHKSGTTLVSQILHRSGIRMGQGDEVEGDYDAGVFHERHDVYDLNTEILGFTFPAQNFPAPRRLALTDAQRARMREIIAKHDAEGGDWGFKEPRCCLTYSLWREELPAHRLVVVTRDLPEVWTHFRKKESPWLLTWRCVRTWSDYNERILDALRMSAAPSVVIDYRELMTDTDEFERLQAFVECPLVDMRQPGKYRSQAGGPIRLAAAGALRAATGKTHPNRIAAGLAQIRSVQVEAFRSKGVQSCAY
jgi:hypothetical protein